MRDLKKGIALVATVTVGGLLLGACATEDYVDQHIAAVNTRLEEMNGQMTSQVSALNTRVASVEQTANQGLQRANAAQALAQGKADAKFVFNDMGEGTAITFDTNKWDLSPAAQSALEAFAEKLKGDNRNVYIQIVGHGDPRGSVAHNRELGGRRALEVQRYLSDQGVALNRMDVVSWGEEKNPNPKDKSPEALQQARRVDLVVLG